MKLCLSLLALLALGALALVAQVKISDLPLKATWSTNTFIEVADMDAATNKSGKVLLTNLNLWTASNNLLFPSSSSAKLYTAASGLPYWLATTNLQWRTNVVFTNLASGMVDLWTCPTGYRAFFVTSFINATTNTSAVSFRFSLKTNSIYYPFSTSNGSASTNGTGFNLPTFFFDPGDVLAVNTGAAGLNLRMHLMLFPTNVPVFSPRLYTLASGTNYVYTAPADKHAFTAGTPPQFINVLSAGQVFYINGSGGARVVSWHIVPAGGVADISNQIAKLTATAGNNGNTPIAFTFEPGESLVCNIDSSAGTTNIVWLTIYENP